MPGRKSRPRAWVSGNNRDLSATVAVLLLLAGCGGSPEPIAEAPPFLDPGFVEAGGYRMHYALTLSRDLPAAIAGSYGIEQRRDLAVLTVAIAPSESRANVGDAASQVEADAVSLIGTRRPLALSRHDEPGAETWIATVGVRHREPITIEIRSRATAEGPALRARLTREFRLE